MEDLCTRLSNTGRLLVRSGIEIERILASMVDDGDAVTASLPRDHLFLSRLVSADEQEVWVAPSDHRPANMAVLAAPSVTLKCNHRGAQFAFSCSHPRPGRRASGQVAIRMGVPKIVLAAQARQEWPRAKQPPAAADVRCELRMGLIAFSGRVVDVGLDGKAFIVSDPALPVCDGTRLNGVRLRNGEGEALVVDLEIDKVVQTVTAEGGAASRIGCRILAGRETLEQMIRLFIVDLQ